MLGGQVLFSGIGIRLCYSVAFEIGCLIQWDMGSFSWLYDPDDSMVLSIMTANNLLFMICAMPRDDII